MFDFNYKDVSATLSSNENYVIITGGWMEFENVISKNNDIFVLDLTNETKYILKKSKIKIPKPGDVCLYK